MRPPPTHLQTLVRVAWLSILLGLGMEVLLLILASLSPAGAETGKSLIASMAHKISWSTLVCIGLAFGTFASRLRPQLMGLLGLLSAPAAFVIARLVHKGVAAALDLGGAGAGGAGLYALAGIKGLQYGFLGWALGRVSKRPGGRALPYVAIGLIAGVVFGGATLYLLAASSAKPQPLDAMLPRGVNEVLFPVGCALVLYITEVLGKRPLP